MKQTLLSLLFVCVANRLVAAETKVDFNRDVRPILVEYCFQCHGPDEKQRKAKLRLDSREGAIAERKRGQAILPKNGTESPVIVRMLSKDESEVMPPPETGKKPKPEQIETLKKWIDQGAEYQGHWAFTAPVRPEPPKVADEKRVRNPIDRFILKRLEKDNLTFSPRADDVTLIRRLYLDLTGLPPTIQQVDTFVNDKAEKKYESLVDSLLSSPRYGERMALEWLDAARFADTHGYHIDSGRDMTRWREWIISAFADNMPFDRFTVEQLAGDLLPNATLSQKVASGFNRNHMINFEGGAIPAEYQNAYIVDRVNTTSTVWMGLTLGCAQCHDHKYDPISQKEYYRLYAFFNNVPENGIDGQKGNAVPFIKVPTTDQSTKLDTLKREIDDLEKQLREPMPNVDGEQAKWEHSPAARKTVWKPVAPAAMTSKGGAELKKLDDQSILASGPNPATEVYTVRFAAPTDKISGLKLEVFADPSFPEKGPGRSANGNFVMTEFQVLVGSGKDAKPVKIQSATARFSQDTFPVSSALSKGKGWATHPQVGQDNFAVFQFAEPIHAPGQEILVRMSFNSQFAQHQFGKFRLATTDSPTPQTDAGIPDNVKIFLTYTPTTRRPEQLQAIKDYYRDFVSPVTGEMRSRLNLKKKEVNDITSTISDAMVMQEMPQPRETFMLVRGQYDKRGDKVTAGTPAVLPPLPKESPVNRLGLANWLVAKDHPLTARVTVNRFWQMYFGTGLVKTAEDFGTTGEWPSHPELLDWLAVEFRESGWDVRHMQKLIVMSSTYQQSSKVTPELAKRDPENRLLARMSRLRLQAEFIRDQALFTSGLLNGEIGGKSVSPYQPKGIWEELTYRQDNANFSAQIYAQSKGKDLYRRTMYTFWKRTAPPPTLVTFDAPDRETCTVRRPRTNTPLQALILLNDPTYVEAGRKLAERILTEGGDTVEKRVTFAFRTVLSRVPTEREIGVLKAMFEKERTAFAGKPQEAEKLLQVGESPRAEKLDTVELAAWTLVAGVLLNLDEAITKN